MKLKPGEYRMKWGGVEWTLKVTDDEPFPDESAWGYVKPATREMVVSTKGNPLATFFHEAEHVMGDICSHDTTSKKPHDELDRRANQWAAFWQNNRDFLRGLLDAE